MTFRADSGVHGANSDHMPNERLWVFDFNLAFDEAFDRKHFFANHVFGGLLKGWPRGFRELMVPRLQQAWSKSVTPRAAPCWLPQLDGSIRPALLPPRAD